MGIIQIQIIPVGSKERRLPNATPKTDPFNTAQLQKIVYDIYSTQEYNPHKILDFTMMGQQS